MPVRADFLEQFPQNSLFMRSGEGSIQPWLFPENNESTRRFFYLHSPYDHASSSLFYEPISPFAPRIGVGLDGNPVGLRQKERSAANFLQSTSYSCCT